MSEPSAFLDSEIVASHIKERVGHPEWEPVDETPAQKPRPIPERIFIEIDPNNERNADKTMLSDMGSFGIVHRIQPARHAKSSYHTNVICDVFTRDLTAQNSQVGYRLGR